LREGGRNLGPGSILGGERSGDIRFWRGGETGVVVTREIGGGKAGGNVNRGRMVKGPNERSGELISMGNLKEKIRNSQLEGSDEERMWGKRD